MRTYSVLTLVLIYLVSSLTFAGPPAGKGVGLGHGHGHGKSISTVVPGSSPPGLYNKSPHGLTKKGKVPPGWSKGKKTGWHKNIVKPVFPVKHD